MICTVCLNIFSGKKRVFNPSYGTNLNVAHHETLEDLERAVDDGCVLCYKFLSFLIRKVGPGIRAKNEKYWFSQCTLAYSGQRGRYNLTLSAKVLASHTQESGRSDPFSNYTDIYVFVLELTPKTDKSKQICFSC